MAEGNGGITYTTKELLLKLEEKIDKIDQKLDLKVDVASFEKMQARVERAADQAVVAALEARLNSLTSQVAIQDRVNEAVAKKAVEVQRNAATNLTRREKVIGIAFAALALAIQLYVLVVKQ